MVVPDYVQVISLLALSIFSVLVGCQLNFSMCLAPQINCLMLVSVNESMSTNNLCQIGKQYQ